jgi:hypothetical protein
VYAPVAGVAVLQQEGRPESTFTAKVVSIGDIPAGNTANIEYWGEAFVRPLADFNRVGVGWRLSADNAQCEWHAVQYARGIAAWLACNGGTVGIMLVCIGVAAVIVLLARLVELVVGLVKMRRQSPRAD